MRLLKFCLIEPLWRETKNMMITSKGNIYEAAALWIFLNNSDSGFLRKGANLVN